MSNVLQLRTSSYHSTHVAKYELTKARVSVVPKTPVIIDIHIIGRHSATISWSEGFHGGSDQTFYYEINCEYTIWTCVLMDTIGTPEKRSFRKTSVNNLMEDTI